MKKVGFVNYYMSEFHGNNYPNWIAAANEKLGTDYKPAYGWAEEFVSPVDGTNTDQWCERNGIEKCETIKELCEKSGVIMILAPSHPGTHLGYAKEVLPFGKPTYIDKTFAPDTATAEEILALNTDGVVISEGPGDPKENQAAIQEIAKLFGKKPLLGVGLGHQLVALATEADTVKMKYGHRGSNQPVKSVSSGRVYISTQNHGYEVISNSIKQGKIKFFNVNDNSCEGIDYEELNAFTTQFAPEACGIGYVENPLYNKFFAMMEKEKENA
jgi:anthranilate/para-aminobenzoate synthase component II